MPMKGSGVVILVTFLFARVIVKRSPRASDWADLLNPCGPSMLGPSATFWLSSARPASELLEARSSEIGLDTTSPDTSLGSGARVMPFLLTSERGFLVRPGGKYEGAVGSVHVAAAAVPGVMGIARGVRGSSPSSKLEYEGEDTDRESADASVSR